MSNEKSLPTSERTALIAAVEHIVIVVGLATIGAVLALHDDREHAGMLLAAALALALPARAKLPTNAARVGVLALGIGASVALGGCSPAELAAAHGTARTIATTTCGVVTHAANVCRRAGLSPSDSCPAPIPIDVETSGDEQ